MPEKDKTQNILNMLEKASIEKASRDEFEFRLQVLTGIAEVKKEFGMFRETTTNQITDLYGKTNGLAMNGCSKALMHADQEERLREVEQDVAVLVHPAPKGTVVNGNGKKVFTLGRFAKWEGFTVQDIIYILFALTLCYWIYTSQQTHYARLQHVESMVKLNGKSQP
jgi:hypothetical protein